MDGFGLSQLGDLPARQAPVVQPHVVDEPVPIPVARLPVLADEHPLPLAVHPAAGRLGAHAEPVLIDVQICAIVYARDVVPLAIVDVPAIDLRPSPIHQAKAEKRDAIVVTRPGQDPIVPLGDNRIPVSVECADPNPAGQGNLLGERERWIIPKVDVVTVAVKIEAPAAVRIVQPGGVTEESSMVTAGAVECVGVQSPVADQVGIDTGRRQRQTGRANKQYHHWHHPIYETGGVHSHHCSPVPCTRP